MSTARAVLRRYWAERAKGYTAGTAWLIAKASQTEPSYPFLAKLDLFGRVDGHVGPFAITVAIEYDQDGRLGDDDVTGWFTDSFEPGCIKNTTNGGNGDGWKWYHPGRDTLENGYAAFRRAGYSKSPARDKLAAQIYQEMVADSERIYHVVLVTASVAGVFLGSASLGWIDVDADDPMPYLWEVAGDLIDEAIGSARAAIPTALETNTAQAHAIHAAQSWQPSPGAPAALAAFQRPDAR
jgi:hypothetical protein